jgi:hypothetical protein
MGLIRACPWARSFYAFLGGESPETIQQSFPSLTLDRVYGTIAFYLRHQAEVDINVRQGEEDVRRLIPPVSESKPETYARLQREREQMPNRSS